MVYRDERQEIEVELAKVIVERDLLVADAYGPIFGGPPF